MPGVGMQWHADVPLMQPPQLELVYTIENSSDSVTRWATSHLDVLRGHVDARWTAPNSGLLVCAGGPVHMVSEVSHGHRAVAKAALILAPADVPHLPAKARVVLLQAVHLLVWLTFVRAVWTTHLFVKLLVVLGVVGHAYVVKDSAGE
mmetsp:Transcript_63977/g.164683  ORF Transcript_63977/g.164683 Transcript_63977/m.164683 type:complete len:148 (+) Transcript_63977:239-682(+)